MSRFDTLPEWLTWLEQLHPKSIDLGLARVFEVAQRLNLLKPATPCSHSYSGPLFADTDTDISVVTVAGTNGKGSCIATLEKALMLSSSVQKNTPAVGSYTSPHLHHYCERIRINGKPVSEALVCSAFTAIDQARGDISLTYFEFGTLAALWIFIQERVAYALLEVGLGGRLDAVNIVDADIAVVTSIDVDHQEWLGSDRNIISQEKLGIARANAPLIIAEAELTENLKRAAESENALLLGRDFSFEIKSQHQWCFQLGDFTASLPLPALPLSSVAAALIVLEKLKRLPAVDDLSTLMKTLALSGRFECVQVGSVDVVYDVAHNPAAAKMLAKRLADSRASYSKTYAVLALMEDKEHEGILAPLLDSIDAWFLGGLAELPRAALPADIASKLSLQLAQDSNGADVFTEDSVAEAFSSAFAQANSRDRIIVFGSFYTVAAAQDFVNQNGLEEISSSLLKL